MKYIIILIMFFNFDLFGFLQYNWKSKPIIKVECKEYRIAFDISINKEIKTGLFFVKHF